MASQNNLCPAKPIKKVAQQQTNGGDSLSQCVYKPVLNYALIYCHLPGMCEWFLAAP